MNNTRLIDTHTHLEQVENVEQALERARATKVAAIVAVGMDLASNRRILTLAKAHPDFVFPALGIHPWAIEASETDATVEFIESHIDKCVAIGEIGLDYWIKQDKDLQKLAFRRLLSLAARHNKPVSTHSRGSYEDVLRLVQESGVKRAVFHWYSGPLELTREIVASGFHISATPAVEYSEKHREVIKDIPLGSLLLETDSPVKYKDVKSEPADVRGALREVAALKNCDPDRVAAATTENAIKLFNLPPVG
jgi:TatD DNase family protein